MSMDITPTDDYVLYADTKKSLAGLNKRTLFFLLPLVVLSFVFCGVFAHGFAIPRHGSSGQPLPPIPIRFDPATTALLTWFPWFLLAECALSYIVMARAHKKPIVVLSAEGITVDTTATHLGLIRWDEIEEVRSYTMIYRYVGIVPKNSSALCRRLGTGRSWILQLNTFCIPLYKLLGIFVAPINIPQVYLPITVDELTARIRAYHEAYIRPVVPAYQSVPMAYDGSIWPPPPARGPSP